MQPQGGSGDSSGIPTLNAIAAAGISAGLAGDGSSSGTGTGGKDGSGAAPWMTGLKDNSNSATASVAPMASGAPSTSPVQAARDPDESYVVGAAAAAASGAVASNQGGGRGATPAAGAALLSDSVDSLPSLEDPAAAGSGLARADGDDTAPAAKGKSKTSTSQSLLLACLPGIMLMHFASLGGRSIDSTEETVIARIDRSTRLDVWCRSEAPCWRG